MAFLANERGLALKSLAGQTVSALRRHFHEECELDWDDCSSVQHFVRINFALQIHNLLGSKKLSIAQTVGTETDSKSEE